MSNLKVTDKELQTVLDELEKDLSGYLQTTQAKLAKAREEDGSAGSPAGSPSASAGGEGAPPEGGAPEGAAPSAAPSAPPSAGAPGEGAPPAGDPGMEGAAPGGDPGMEGAAPGGDPAMEGQEGQGPADPAALEAEYAKLPVEELKAHYLAAKAALFAVMGGDGAAAGGAAPAPAGPSAGAPAGPSAGAPPPAGPSAGAPPMAMSEGKNVAGVSQAGNGGQKTAVAKSEQEAALQAQLDEVTKILQAFVGRPMRKAATGTDFGPRTEAPPAAKPLNSNEITQKLSELTRKPDLKKSDRDAITGYYEGRVSIAAIEHLLK